MQLLMNIIGILIKNKYIEYSAVFKIIMIELKNDVMKIKTEC